MQASGAGHHRYLVSQDSPLSVDRPPTIDSSKIVVKVSPCVFQSPTGAAVGTQQYLYPVQQTMPEMMYQPHYITTQDMTDVDATAAAAAEVIMSKLD